MESVKRVMADTERQSEKPTTMAAKRARRRLIFNQVVLNFAIGCIFGTYYEELITLFKNFMGTGQLIWESRRGLVYGPFSPIYGMGAVGIYLLFYRRKRNWQASFFGGALLGGAFEYFLSWLQEMVFGTRSWDYTGRPLNIGGRTTVIYMVFWGLLVFLVADLLCPWLDKLYHKVKPQAMNMFCTVLAVFLLFDITVSVLAVGRQAMRRAGDPADTVIEQFFDWRFPDERLQQVYSNTHYVRE